MNPLVPVFADADGSCETTRWNLVLESSTAATEAAAFQALSELCQVYWKPVFLFLLPRCDSREDAKDLTQDFFVTVLRGDFLQRADPRRGRFRSLLWTSLKNFAMDSNRHFLTLRKGGDQFKISLHDLDADLLSTVHQVQPRSLWVQSEESEQFDLRWAMVLSQRVLARLRREHAALGRERVFVELSAFLADEADQNGYGPAAALLGVSRDVVRMMVNRLRMRYRALLRAEVAETLADPDDAREELAYLFSLLSSKAAPHA